MPAPRYHPEQLLHAGNGATYVLGRKLGAGGMGAVYLAQQRAGNQPQGTLVALKLLRPQAHAMARRLFYHEGALLPRLQHTNIVRCLERGRGLLGGMGSVDYMALGFVAGETAEELLQRREQRLPLTTVLGMLAQITAALAYMHQRGVVHCDLKPSNLMLERASARAILIDFGIARAPDFVGQPIAVGTPQYMAPEQIDVAGACDGRADIYALGVMLYELLTGRRLFPRRTTTDIRNGALVTVQPADLLDVGPQLARVVARCINRDPDERYQRVGDLLADMQQAIAAQGEPGGHQLGPQGELL